MASPRKHLPLGSARQFHISSCQTPSRSQILALFQCHSSFIRKHTLTYSTEFDEKTKIVRVSVSAGINTEHDALESMSNTRMDSRFGADWDS